MTFTDITAHRQAKQTLHRAFGCQAVINEIEGTVVTQPHKLMEIVEDEDENTHSR